MISERQFVRRSCREAYDLEGNVGLEITAIGCDRRVDRRPVQRAQGAELGLERNPI
jgi:hypothetical protein